MVARFDGKFYAGSTLLAHPDITEEEDEAMNELTKQLASARQIGGDHYKKLPIQPMEYSMKNKLDACQHTIIKYVTRFRDKGGIQDLEKAKHVIDLLIQFEGESK